MRLAPRDRSLPERDELLLLHAALDTDDESALGSWRQWRTANVLDPMGTASYRLLPLIYRRLAHLDADPRDLQHLKNVYRYEWYANQVLMRAAAGVLVQLRDAQIPTLVLKGAALQALHYRDAGTRPMQDVDVLVPTAAVHDAIDVLVDGGWRPEYLQPHQRVGIHHSQSFSHPDDCDVDLHWHALYQPANESDLWEGAVPVTVGGVETLAASATDQLLHVCVHGRNRSETPSVRWIADAAAVLRGSEVDWSHFVDRARARGVTLTAGSALRYLRAEFDLDVPEAALRSLAAARPSLSERSAYELSLRLSPVSHVRAAVVLWNRLRRQRAVDPPYAAPRSYPAYVAQAYGFGSPRGLLAEQFRRAVGRGRSASARGYKPA
jgi:hypothetical protein